jgi:hypothetical protein
MLGNTAFAQAPISDLGSASLGVNVAVIGVSASALLNSVAVDAEASAPVTGVLGTTGLGVVSIDAEANVTLTGVSGTGELTSALVWGNVPTSQDPNWQVIAA